MKTVSANLLAHLQGVALTVSTLWKVTRTDAQVFGFTDNSSDLTYLGVTYEALTGHIPSNIQSTATLSVDNLEVQAALNSESITDADILAGLWDDAVVEIMVVNYANLAHGHMLLRKGTIGNIKTGRVSFTAELRGMTQALQQTAGRVYKSSCDALLGDTRCGVSLGPFTTTGFPTTAISQREFVDAGISDPSGYYDGGLVMWTSGDNDNLSMEIKTSSLVHTIATGITSITKASSAIVTVANNFVNGDIVSFAACLGMAQINGLSGTISSRSPTGFTVSIDSTSFSTYTGSAGYADRIDGTRFTLQLPMPYAIDIADTYNAIAGCDKTLPTCKAKFNNVLNFRGFPHIPGSDHLINGS